MASGFSNAFGEACKHIGRQAQKNLLAVALAPPFRGRISARLSASGGVAQRTSSDNQIERNFLTMASPISVVPISFMPSDIMSFVR